MTQLNTFAITGTTERFQEGVGAFRNARDWAKEQRDWLVTAANSRASGTLKETTTLQSSIHSMSQSIMGLDRFDPETSAEELSQDVKQGSIFSKKRFNGIWRSVLPILILKSNQGRAMRVLKAGLAAQVASCRSDSVFDQNLGAIGDKYCANSLRYGLTPRLDCSRIPSKLIGALFVPLFGYSSPIHRICCTIRYHSGAAPFIP